MTMICDLHTESPLTAGDLRSLNRKWIQTQHSVAPGLQCQLQFNDTVAPSVLNRATRVGRPSPIMIEKLLDGTDTQDVESCSSSVRLSVVSEEKLHAAVRLAKRDLRRKHHESISRLSCENPLETSQTTSPQKHNTDHSVQFSSGGTPKMLGLRKQTKPGTQGNLCTPLKPSNEPRPGGTPPTKDLSKEQQLSREIQRLRKELNTYVQRIEQLTDKGHAVQDLEPDEKRRMEIRRQEQAARSARIIYVLQKQVKEIQEDLDKLGSQNIKQTKKITAVDRLAAAHRGAIRAMQAFISQLSDPAERKVPAHCRELGQLIRQLSLCSAKVEVRQGSSVPEATLDILQKLETLDSALNKQEKPKERDPDIQNINPVEKSSVKVDARSTSPPHPIRAPAKRTSRRAAPCKPAAGKTTGGRIKGRKPHRISQALLKERNDILKAGLESLIQNKPGRETQPPKTKTNISVINTAQVKQAGPVGDSSFQQPTVSSRLRENHIPQREITVPWIPTSPHSPSTQRVVSSQTEPRCLFSSVKSPEKNLQLNTPNTQLSPTSHDRKQVQNEALRTTVGSPTQWAEKAEPAVRESIQPLLDQAQQVVGAGSPSLRERLKVADNSKAMADVLSEAVLDDLLEDAAGAIWTTKRQKVDEIQAERQLQRPTLESMLLRMEEMERDQEEVRRRFAMISYSDSLTWDKGTDTERNRSSSRPGSPQPLRLTKPVLNAPWTADIILQKPLETGAVSETSMLDDECSVLKDLSHTAGVYLNVPPNMQRNIQKYRENHDAFLQLLSHETVGNFNPWTIADSLAKELMDEALADVAAEFQDVCEEYAEAVFTSEFLQPVRSPTT